MVGRPQARWKIILGIGLFLGLLKFSALFIGMDLGMPAGLASLTLQAQAFFTVLFAAVWLKERPKPRHLVGMADGPRALYRSGHIYILFSALLHALIGVYFLPARSLPGRLVQMAGSALLFASLGLFLYGFFVETPIGAIERPMIRNAIVWSLAGVLLHGIGGLLPGSREGVPARAAAVAAAPHAGALDRDGGSV